MTSTKKVEPPDRVGPWSALRQHRLAIAVSSAALCLLLLLSAPVAFGADDQFTACSRDRPSSEARSPLLQPAPAPEGESSRWIAGITERQGAYLQSPTGDFGLQVRGLLQTDYRSFPGGQNETNPGVVSARLVAQRARPTVIACLYRQFKFTVTPDFGNGIASPPQMFIATAEWDYHPALRFTYGLQKIPASLEVVQAVNNSVFMERSLVRDLAPLLAIGGLLSGQILENRLEYQIGFWNDAASANVFQVGKVFSPISTVTARIFLRPFMHHANEWLRGLGVGFAATQGWIFDTAGQFPMQTETFSYTFFQFNPNVSGDGPRSRYIPQAYWYWKRIGVVAQYLRKESRFRLIDGPSAKFRSEAWTAQASLMLTDDDATFGQVTPRRPFTLDRPGHWGAWELAVRHAQLVLDPATFTSGFVDPTRYAQHIRSSTAALNWYWNAHLRFEADYVHTDFVGALPSYSAASHEDALMFRMQVVF